MAKPHCGFFIPVVFICINTPQHRFWRSACKNGIALAVRWFGSSMCTLKQGGSHNSKAGPGNARKCAPLVAAAWIYTPCHNERCAWFGVSKHCRPVQLLRWYPKTALSPRSCPWAWRSRIQRCASGPNSQPTRPRELPCACVMAMRRRSLSGEHPGGKGGLQIESSGASAKI